MMTTRKLTSGIAAPSLWMRWLALVSLLIIVVASSAQAAHIHGDFLPHHEPHAATQNQSPQAGDEASCPLCVAMHSALPTSANFQATIQLPVTSPAVEVLSRASSPDWHFTLFSRPPPSSAL